MNKIIIIPLGGIGKRFLNSGYNTPKPLIHVFGKPIIFWLLEKLDYSDIECVYIPYHKDLSKYRFEDLLKHKFPEINFIFLKLEIETRGTVDTIRILLNNIYIDENKTVICIDCDNFYTENVLKLCTDNNIVIIENDIGDPIYSYVKLDDNNIIIDIVEKQKISNRSSCGIYSFKTVELLKNASNHVINNNISEYNGEYYISSIIKYLTSIGIFFTGVLINKDSFHSLGTPLAIKIFCNNKKIVYEKKRYCFDLDNTLVSFPKVKGDYTTVEPIQNTIDIVKFLKSLGHIIIIHTARNMKTTAGNIGIVNKNIGLITFETLEKFNIPYDELYFGKPYADYYIDDLAISSFSNLEKEFGFYKTGVDPRYFNSLEISTIETIKKKSNDLSGEIYYYNTISRMPNIKDLFPIMINYGSDNTWYQIEKINGVTISKLYLSEELTTDILCNVMNELNSLHNSINNINELNKNDKLENLNIYESYVTKIKNRYANYNYQNYPNNKKIYDELIEQLTDYEINKKGKIKMIHGDPVFTNIILDTNNKLKFIDMRGKIGNQLTVYGDWLYDWAKIYQSLIGYDEILCDVDLQIIYKKNIIKFFTQEFIKNNSEEDFKNIKLITKSLLFTLIPLHDNDKCIKYYNLINSIYL